MSDSMKEFFTTLGIILSTVMIVVIIMFLVTKDEFSLGQVLPTAIICQVPTEFFILKVFDMENKIKDLEKELKRKNENEGVSEEE